MKTTHILWIGVFALAVGCASDRERYHARYGDRYYVTEEHPTVTVRSPGEQEVIINPNSTRTYVRERDTWRRENNMEPRYRGKHPDALGWNDPHWYGY